MANPESGPKWVIFHALDTTVAIGVVIFIARRRNLGDGGDIVKTLHKFVLMVLVGLFADGCAQQSLPPPKPAMPPVQPPALSNNQKEPDIFNIMVDGKTYNRMDDARQAMADSAARLLANISPAASPKFGQLIIYGPAVNVPAVSIPGASPDHLAKVREFLHYLHGHNLDLTAQALTKTNDFKGVSLRRGETWDGSLKSDSDIVVWSQRDAGREVWWLQSRNYRGIRLAANPNVVTLDNIQALRMEVTKYGYNQADQ